MQRLNRLSFFIKGLCYYLITLVTVALSVAAENSYGPVQSGDILWKIAQNVRPDSSVNRYQTMLALFRANPDAFKIPCNINSLIVGKYLLIPSLAEIEAINPTLAKNTIDQHNAEWKNYRQSRQPIRCPASPAIIATVPSSSVPQNQVEPKRNVEPVREEETTAVSQKAPILPQKQPVVLTTTSWQFLLSQPILWVMITFMVIFFLSSTILITRLFYGFIHKLFPTKYQREDGPESLPATLLPNTLPEKTATDLPNDPENPEIAINKKLDTARELLAKGETQTVKSQLLDVMDQGNQNQRREARQLLEINQQISTLELNLLQVQRMTTPSKTPATVSQEEMLFSPAVPLQSYLSENKSEIFKLVDKIFTVLDQELNAKGQLIEAYHDRHKPELFSATEYKNLKNSEEKILVEQSDALQAQESKTIRYL